MRKYEHNKSKPGTFNKSKIRERKTEGGKQGSHHAVERIRKQTGKVGQKKKTDSISSKAESNVQVDICEF